ncbi:MAG: gamma-glutamylcyclotransferase [Clostridiales bacterium]|nr:gamma-glutamylcyclotransferase [Clostridiales bacterium]
MKYIAYGSNMSREQMAYRCPDARLLGTGYICGARLEFYLHATVEKTGNEQDQVPVAVWEISPQGERRLDMYEGVPAYYIKEEWPVLMSDGSETVGMIYLMKQIRQSSPRDEYYEGIAGAYRMLGLESRISTVLQPALERSRKRSPADAAGSCHGRQDSQ